MHSAGLIQNEFENETNYIEGGILNCLIISNNFVKFVKNRTFELQGSIIGLINC